MKKRALVLAGGSVKGAWQSGAIKAIIESGFIPDIITGISVGALNGSWIANKVGAFNNIGKKFDWDKDIADGLMFFWVNNITNSESITVKRKMLPLLWDVYKKKFKGITDTTPLKNLVEKTINIDNIKNSGIDLIIGAVNVDNSRIKYVTTENLKFIEYIIASAAIPVMMPTSYINNIPYVDGGIRDSAPLKSAIDAGAEEIICVATGPENMENIDINTGDVMQFTERLMSIISDNNLNNDIKKAQLINKLLEDGQYQRKPKVLENHLGDKKFIDLKIIRPDKTIDVNISKFTSEDIKGMIHSGYEHTSKCL